MGRSPEIPWPHSPDAPRSFLADSLRSPGKLRIGYSANAVLTSQLDLDCVDAVEDAAALLESLGHELVEVDLPNSDLALYPGMYATLDLKVPLQSVVAMIPDDALVFRDGKVYAPLVRANHIHLSEVTLGEDNGREVQITRGVADNDLVALNVGQGVHDADAVQPQRLDQAQPQDLPPTPSPWGRGEMKQASGARGFAPLAAQNRAESAAPAARRFRCRPG